MNVTINFRVPEEQEEFDDAMHGTKYRAQLDEIWNKIFRPAFGGRYSGRHADELNLLIDNGSARHVIDMLSDIYREITKDNN